MADVDVARPTANLLDTILLCEQRQDWYLEFALANVADPLPFVGSLTPGSDVAAAASEIRATLGFEVAERDSYPSWTEALRALVDQAEAGGLLVMISGVVGNRDRS